jgi:hypothetical protein
MAPAIKKSNEPKLEALKSIIRRSPFGYTLVEIFRKFKDEHEVGSRNTLRNYLELLLEAGEIEVREVGNYRIFRSKNRFTMENLYKNYPHLEQLITNFFAVLSKVLDKDLPKKAKQIGIEIAKKSPMLESKAIQQFKKFQDFFAILPFKQFIENLSKRTLLELKTDAKIHATETEATLIFKDTKALRDEAWSLFYMLAGVIEYNLNEIFLQNVTVTVESITQNECVILARKN